MDSATNATDTLVTILVLVGLATLLLLPALVGQCREWRVDRQLREAERGAYAPAPGDASGNGRREDLVAIHVTPPEVRARPRTADTCTAA